MKKKWTILSLLGLCIIAGIFVYGRTMTASAIFDEATAVPYSQFAASHTIEDSTLFIGTHLIHSQALTDELYEKALDSASESGQSDVYYKSELAGGVWFNITDASSLAEISTAGVIVEERELANLWVTHWTDSGGVTHEAISGEAVNIFDTPDPYDLYNLPELEPIRIQYDNLFSSESTGVDAYYYEILLDFFSLELKNSVTDECDRQLKGLQTCYETLQAQDETELAEIVSTLMSRIDARRRAEIFALLSQIDENELNKLQELCSGSEFDKEDDDDEEEDEEEEEDDEEGDDEDEEEEEEPYDGEQFVENANVMDAIGSAMENCQESYIENSGKMLEEDDTTVLKSVEYEDSMQIADMSAGGWSSQMEQILLELRDLYHIQDDIIANQDEELSLLDSKLLTRATDKYVQSISAGTNGKYLASAANGASEAARQQILEEQKIEADAVRSELQYLVQAKTNRMDSQAGVDYIYGQIDSAEGYKGGIPSDAFARKAEETVDAYILWLQQLARSIISGDVEMTSEMQDLEARKEELQNERADALADNDLSAVRRYDAMIDAVDADIDAKQTELNAILTNPNSSAADKARAANEAGDSTLLNNINQMKNSALEAIAAGDLDGDSLSNMLDGLAAMGAEGALNDIKDSLTGGSGSGAGTGDGSGSGTGDGSGDGTGDGSGDGTGDGSGSESRGGSGDSSDLAQSDLLDAIENAIDESKESSLHGLLDGGGSGTSGGIDLSSLIEDLFGVSFGDLLADDKAAVTAAADRIGEAGNPSASELAGNFLNQCLRESNAYVYEKLKGQASEYIPLKTIAYATGYRYVYSDSKREATLSRKGKVFTFVVFGNEVVLKDKSKEQLTAKVQMQSLPYVARTDARKYFSCEAEYIESSNYGICLNEKMQRLVDEIIKAATEGEEEDG